MIIKLIKKKEYLYTLSPDLCGILPQSFHFLFARDMYCKYIFFSDLFEGKLRASCVYSLIFSSFLHRRKVLCISFVLKSHSFSWQSFHISSWRSSSFIFVAALCGYHSSFNCCPRHALLLKAEKQ